MADGTMVVGCEECREEMIAVMERKQEAVAEGLGDGEIAGLLCGVRD